MITQTMLVKFRASIDSVDENKGTVTLQIPVRELTDTEDAVLNNLFPNLQEQVRMLLAKETVLETMEC